MATGLGQGLDRHEAWEIIEKILDGKAPIVRRDHFKMRLRKRGYTIADVRRVLREGRIEQDPEIDPQWGNHTVLVRGNSWDGRDTRIVLALRSTGTNFYITIVDIEHVGPAGSSGP